MKVIKCDRCGGTPTKNFTFKTKLYDSDKFEIAKWDLCDYCKEALIEFIKNEDKNESKDN